ncbi:Protein of unknown function [Gryllus bimaculatus]|nr:Protein of unknown function [Gryllus bimaculatus]
MVRCRAVPCLPCEAAAMTPLEAAENSPGKDVGISEKSGTEPAKRTIASGTAKGADGGSRRLRGTRPANARLRHRNGKPLSHFPFLFAPRAPKLHENKDRTHDTWPSAIM